MADHDGGSGQGGGGGGGPMVVDTQAVGTGPGAAAQLPGQRTAAPVQRPGPHLDAVGCCRSPTRLGRWAATVPCAAKCFQPGACLAWGLDACGPAV